MGICLDKHDLLIGVGRATYRDYILVHCVNVCCKVNRAESTDKICRLYLIYNLARNTYIQLQ